MHERALSRSGWADDCNDLSSRDGDVAYENLPGPDPAADIVDTHDKRASIRAIVGLCSRALDVRTSVRVALFDQGFGVHDGAHWSGVALHAEPPQRSVRVRFTLGGRQRIQSLNFLFICIQPTATL